MVGIFGGVLVVLLLITVVLPGGTAPFSGGSFTKVERSMQAKGLHICHTVDRKPGVAEGSLESRRYDVAFDCQNDIPVHVLVNRYEHRDDRDSALHNLETLIRPDDGSSYSYGRFSILVTGRPDDKAQQQIDRVLRSIGAK